jgi:carbon-monoxide dehydrogenase iron sulfur subunit
MSKLIYARAKLCTGCKICAMACSINKFGKANPMTSGITIHRDPFARYEWQAICRHCETPECVDACMTGSLQKDPQTGIVFNDFEKCVGCWACIMVCPYGAITAAYEHGVAVQCDQCRGEDAPICVQVCPTEALVYAEKPEKMF